MPSVIPGYEYDIFISYRHNDNRSGWVTEFVKLLQEELAATIKESVSVRAGRIFIFDSLREMVFHMKFYHTILHLTSVSCR